MKTILSLLFALFVCGHMTNAQKLNFETDSLSAVLQKAKKLQKPVFIVVTGPPVSSETLKQVRESQLGLQSAEVTKQLNSQFLNYQTTFRSDEANKLTAQYNIRTFPTYLYLNPDGNLIHRNVGSFSAAQRYLDDIKAFKEKKNSPHTLSNYQQQFEKGRRDADFLYQYLLLHKELDVRATQELLDTYTLSLDRTHPTSLSEVVFLHEFGPVVNSASYHFARIDKSLVDNLYTTLPLAKRIEINNKIIANTMRAAIASKDRALAEQGAIFAGNTWAGDRVRSQQTYLRNMISFYRGSNDTASFLLSNMTYYNQYYMNISLDSAATIVANEKKARQSRQTNASSAIPDIANKPGTYTEVKTVVSVETANSAYTVELNNAAYLVYLAKPKSNLFLLEAANWSRRTIDLEPSVPYYDTYAHLLYSLADYKASEEAMMKAIELTKQRKANASYLEEKLSKIKERKL